MLSINDDICSVCGERAEYGLRINTLDGSSYCMCLGCLEKDVIPAYKKEEERSVADAFRAI